MDWSRDPKSTDWFINDFTDDEESVGDDNELDYYSDSMYGVSETSRASNSSSFASGEGIAISPHVSTTQARSTDVESPPKHVRLLYIAELAQLIFANLSLRNRVICTSVCKTWRRLLLRESPTAFEMFMQPRQQPSFTMLTMPCRGLPLEWTAQWTQRWHNNLNTQMECQKLRCVKFRPHRAVDERLVNPMFLELCITEETCLRVNGHCASFIFVTADAVAGFLDLHRDSSQDAGWRKMFLTNPPVRRLWAYSDLQGDVAENDDGVRLGQVALYLAEIVNREKRKGMEEGREEAVEKALVAEHSRT